MKDLYGNLEKHLHELCLMPSRHVGSPGAAAAADYIEKTFRSYGFTEVKRLPFPATGWRFGSRICRCVSDAVKVTHQLCRP